MDLSQKRKRTTLLDSEWAIVISLMLIMISMVIIAKVNAYRSSSYLLENPIVHHAPCEIVIDGEVLKPGTFMVTPGTQLKNVIRKSRPTPFSDLKNLDLKRALEVSEHIHVGKLTEISITIQGLLSERSLVIPAGTRMCHLKSYVDLSLEWPYIQTKSRRILKDGDVVWVNHHSSQPK